MKLKKETKAAEDKKSAEFKEKMTKSFLQTNKNRKKLKSWRLRRWPPMRKPKLGKRP